MPLYELLCLARPVLQREDLRRMIAKIGRTVYDKGGVVMDVQSYGLHPLAYKIRGVHGKYDQVG
jgi:ribosomal protein S6